MHKSTIAMTNKKSALAVILWILFPAALASYQPQQPPPDPSIMRAWTCHGRNQRDMVDKLTQAGIVQSPIVRKAMNLVDRGNYVSHRPYDDTPQSIGFGQTISAPHMHAHVLELMVPALEKTTSSHLSLLDVGCGSGYLTAAMGRLVDPPKPLIGVPGKVYGVDVWPGLIEMSKNNINKADGDLIQDGTVTVQLSDGWKGLPSMAPFDAIHVGAAASDFPEALMMQLKVGGVLIIPVGPDGGAQVLYRVQKVADHPVYDRNDFIFTELLGVRYVPLVHP